MRTCNQRGEGRGGFLLTLAVFSLGVFLAVKIVPVRIDAYQFRDTLRDEARYAAVHKNDQKVVERILDRAEELSIPLKQKNLKIKRTRNEVVIHATYEKPIDLKVTTYTFRFDDEQRAPLF